MARTPNDWLADDEGNLRPDVARVLSEAPPPMARRATQLVTRPVGRPAPTIPLWLIPLAFWAGGFLLAVRIVGCWQDTHRASPVVLSQSAPMQSASTPPTGQPSRIPAGASIVGDNVIVRSGPGRTTGEVARLSHGESVQVTQCDGDWCAIHTAAGISGWVFAAYVRGAQGDWVGSAVVTRFLRLGTTADCPVLRVGDKVLVRSLAGDVAELHLPDGSHAEVPRDAVVILE